MATSHGKPEARHHCPACKRSVVECVFADGLILLDPRPVCYVAVAPDHVFPRDHDRVFLSPAMVEHQSICIAQDTRRKNLQSKERTP